MSVPTREAQASRRRMASSVSLSPRPATRNRARALFVIAALGFQMLGLATPVAAAESAPAPTANAVSNLPIPPVTITLVSGGGSGGDGSADPDVTYSIPEVSSGSAKVMPQTTYPVVGAYAAPITGTRWINTTGTAVADQASGDAPTLTTPEIRKTATYSISFVLPPGFSAPSISIDLMSDNCAIASLNGIEVGRQPQTPCVDPTHFTSI